MKFSAVILAGGKSSRMGQDKAFLETGGQILLARQIQVARETGASEIIISGRADVDYSVFGCKVLQDKFPDAGPLAGIERSLDATKLPLLLVLAVDLPNMSAEFLRRLAVDCTDNSGAVPRLNKNIEPLAAFYPKAVHPVVETLLRAGENSAARFAEQCVRAGLARFFEATLSEEENFANWNSPADLHPLPNVLF
jgi:molybdopterin-guanine dinucleotide biosynthesis protein A